MGTNATRCKGRKTTMTKRKRSTVAALVAQRAEERFQPKAGPGDLYVKELVSAKTGRELRYRNIGGDPLTLAHARGRISNEQYAAGEALREIYELRATTGHDSTDISWGSGGGAGLPFTQVQVDAIKRLDRLRKELKMRDWIILEKFCCEGWQMADAVRAATLCHPSGVLMRAQEALDELIDAFGALKSA